MITIMPRLIALLRNYLPYPNAVGICAESIITDFASKYKNYEVIVICEKTRIDQPVLEFINEIKILRFLTKQSERKCKKKNIFLNRLRGYLYDIFSINTGNREMVSFFYNKLVELNLSKDDIVVPFCAPFESIIACEKIASEKHFKLVPILYDLYSGCNYTNRNIVNRVIKFPFNRHYEKKMEKLATHIIYSKVWESYLKKSKKQNKATRAEVPLLFPKIAIPKKGVFDDKYINIVYCGNFNARIRKSTLFCAFFNNVLKEQKDVIIHIIGNGNSDSNIINLKESFQDNVILYGNMPHDDAIFYLNECQMIVVVGNEVQKQFPSKIIEALSFSKKMIVLTKKSNDYYDLFAKNADCLIIDKKNINNLLLFKAFLKSPHSNENYYMKDIFEEFTPQYITSIISKVGEIDD